MEEKKKYAGAGKIIIFSARVFNKTYRVFAYISTRVDFAREKQIVLYKFYSVPLFGSNIKWKLKGKWNI